MTAVSGRVVSLLYHDVLLGRDPSPAETELLGGTEFSRSAHGEVSGYSAPDAEIYKLPAGLFERHLMAIAAAGFAPGLVGDAEPDQRNPVSAVYLTFDDGGASAHSVIAPLLERRGWLGHFFVATDHIGASGFMDAEQLRDLRARGHLVGSHSCSHPERMSNLGDEDLAHEWERSVAVLSELLGERVTTGSVPNGYYSRRVGRAAEAAGIEWLFTSEPTTRPSRVGRCALIGRFIVQVGTSAAAVADLVAPRSRARLSQAVSWKAKGVAKRLGGEVYLRLRARALDRRGD